MLVNDCMTRHPIMVPPEMPVTEVQQIMNENSVRHLPVVGDGKRLVGLITRQRLTIKPDTISSLNIWEITRYLSNMRAQQIMLRASINEVHTIEPHRTVERAARYMAEFKIGCLPVLNDNVVVGMLSEVDLLRSLQEMLGLPASGVRVTVRMPNERGQFSALTDAISKHSMGIMGIGSFPSHRHPGYYDMVLKIPNRSLEEVKSVIEEIPDQEIVDIREDI